VAETTTLALAAPVFTCVRMASVAGVGPTLREVRHRLGRSVGVTRSLGREGLLAGIRFTSCCIGPVACLGGGRARQEPSSRKSAKPLQGALECLNSYTVLEASDISLPITSRKVHL